MLAVDDRLVDVHAREGAGKFINSSHGIMENGPRLLGYLQLHEELCGDWVPPPAGVRNENETRMVSRTHR